MSGFQLQPSDNIRIEHGNIGSRRVSLRRRRDIYAASSGVYCIERKFSLHIPAYLCGGHHQHELLYTNQELEQKSNLLLHHSGFGEDWPTYFHRVPSTIRVSDKIMSLCAPHNVFL